ncbi:HGGxSTG domain-containing protein [Sulfitobacter sp.]|uniref:HGGxSTG domain-containing protein n=1 Tax=Sulfitobacter sp. TaxID=1903071 RepID=UPI003FCDF94F
MLKARGLDDDRCPLPHDLRPECGAGSAHGSKCKRKVVAGKSKCSHHGGASTGPRTAEGLERISRGQIKRWAEYRRVKNAGG